MKEQILKLRAEGKTYNEIKEELGCSKSTISYHCGKDQKNKTNIRSQKWREKNPFHKKTEVFKSRALLSKSRDFQRNRENGKHIDGRVYDFTYEDVINKIGDKPICYLTGEPIDITKTTDYNFDHIIPINRGGSGELNNLGIATKIANRSKNDLLLEEYLDLCKRVLENHGFEVNKKEK